MLVITSLNQDQTLLTIRLSFAWYSFKREGLLVRVNLLPSLKTLILWAFSLGGGQSLGSWASLNPNKWFLGSKFWCRRRWGYSSCGISTSCPSSYTCFRTLPLYADEILNLTLRGLASCLWFSFFWSSSIGMGFLQYSPKISSVMTLDLQKCCSHSPAPCIIQRLCWVFSHYGLRGYLYIKYWWILMGKTVTIGKHREIFSSK